MENKFSRASASERLTAERLYALLYRMSAEMQEIRSEIKALEKKLEEIKT